MKQDFLEECENHFGMKLNSLESIQSRRANLINLFTKPISHTIFDEQHTPIMLISPFGSQNSEN
jgi:hypothetical protein